MTLGAIQDEALIYEMGTEIARQCKGWGYINFAPVVDVNSNPNNPIINNRSFGEDPQSVAKLGIAYMQGLQDGGVLACAKHFRSWRYRCRFTNTSSCYSYKSSSRFC